jgi:hypothetical protein
MRVMGARPPGSNAGFVKIWVSALFINIDLIWIGVRFGNACSSCAAAPETIGAAPEVPPKAVSPVPVPTCADTDAPGAPISGLIVFSADGPREDVLAMLPTSGMPLAGEIEALTTSPAFSRALIALDSTC